MTISFHRAQPKSIIRLSSGWSRGLWLTAALLPSLVLGQSTYTPYAFTTLAGLASIGSTNGTAEASHFNHAAAVAVDSLGNTFVADTENSSIRKITPAGVVTTFAGSNGDFGSVDGTGSAARFFDPAGITVDSSDNIYVADTGNDTIRKITSAGVVTTLAGSAGNSGFADGTGSAARFNLPLGIIVDSAGNVYIGDSGNNTIRKITSAGVVTTLAGQGMLASTGSVDGTARAARFNLPQDTAIDGSGNIFVADAFNHTIRKITSAGVVTTLAGSPGVRGSTDGTGSAASFNYPTGVAVDGSGNVYVADNYNDTIRKITLAGVVTTIAGTPGVAGDVDGLGTGAKFNSPNSVAVYGSGSNLLVYVTDTSNQTIRKIAADGTVTTLAGLARNAGIADGTGSGARLYNPTGITLDSSGNLYATDTGSSTIRKVTSDGVVTTVAGLAGATGTTDGTGTGALFYSPQDVAVDGSGNLFVADSYNCTIRKVTSAGVVTTIAGTAGIKGQTDAVGVLAKFSFPSGLSVDSSGNLYVADTNNNTIRKIASDATVTTFAGAASNAGYADGTGSAARFSSPAGVAVDSSGNLYVADTGNNTVRKVTAAGVVSFYAGAGVTGGAGITDGSSHAARFSGPNGIAVDSAGVAYVSDTGNNTIRQIAVDGTVSTLAGAAGSTGYLDSTGIGALFNGPFGLALDSAANVYVADVNNNAIRKILSGAVVTTLAGTFNNAGSADGTGTAARFNYPNGITVDGAGNLYVTDNGNSTIRKIAPGGVVTTLAGLPGSAGTTDGTGSAARFDFPSGLTIDSAGTLIVADTLGYTIRKVTTSGGVVTTLSGLAATSGSTDGAATNATFASPVSVAVDNSSSIVYVADPSNQLIRKVAADGTVTTLAGMAATTGSTDGTGTAALFFSPQGVAVDTTGNVYVADSGNEIIRKINTIGVVTTLAGMAGTKGRTDASGTFAQFNTPYGLAVDSTGNVFVADTYNHTIRKITPGGVVTTVAGTAGSTGYSDGVGTAASFYKPTALTVDSSGNLYVTDAGNNLIRMISPAGVVSTVAGVGTQGSKGNTDGAGTAARFNEPGGLAIDSSGNLYVGDTFNATIRKITSAGVVSTLAGAVKAAGTADGVGNAAQFYYPYGVAVDSSGNIYVADAYNATIRKCTADGVVTTLAGMASVRGSLDGTGSAAEFYKPIAVAVDSANNVYVADNANCIIRKVTSAGVVTTLAGQAGYSGYFDAAGSNARFGSPLGVAVDGAGNLYVTDAGSNTVRKITPAGVVTTLAGSSGNSSTVDGTGTAAGFARPAGIAVDGSGNVYVADSGSQTIRRITSAGVVTTLGGAVGISGSTDGTGSNALFNFPTALAVDSSGNIYVADTMNNTIRKGVQTAGSWPSGSGGSGGSGSGGSSGSGSGGSGSGSSTNLGSAGSPNSSAGVVLFLYPTSLAKDSAGNLFVADASSNTIQKVTTAGVVTTFAGMAGVAGTTDASGSNARFNQPNGVTVDSTGNVYVADTGNAMIRKVTSDGTVTTLAGTASNRGNQDGSGTSAWFSSPTGISIDSAGNLYVADAFTQTIRKITSTGTVSTLAGMATISGEADGTGTAASFHYPTGTTVDSAGNVYVADAYNNTIRKITSGGVVTTLAGDYRLAGAIDATGSNAQFSQPIGLAVDTAGSVYVADTVNCTIRKVTSAGVVTTIAGIAGIAGLKDATGSSALFNQPRGVLLDGSGGLYVADTGNAAIRKIAADSTVSTPVMTQPATSTATTTSSSGGGGGDFGAWFVGLFALLGLMRWIARKN